MAKQFLSGIDTKFVTGLDDPLLPTDAVNRQYVEPKLIPINGLYRQKLIKSSDTNYDVEWADEEDRMKKYIDEIDDTLLYIGTSPPGTLESAAGWAISKVSCVGDDIFITWADSVNSFTKVWDNRLIYTYG